MPMSRILESYLENCNLSLLLLGFGNLGSIRYSGVNNKGNLFIYVMCGVHVYIMSLMLIFTLSDLSISSVL